MLLECALRLIIPFQGKTRKRDMYKGRRLMSSQTRLLYTRRFLPLFVTQFFGALNDNILKNALVILLTLIALKIACAM